MAAAHGGGCCWLSSVDRVFRASSEVRETELSGAVALGLKQSDGRHDLEIELDAASAAFGTWLRAGLSIRAGLGCLTALGEEVVEGPWLTVESVRSERSPGKSTIRLAATGGWARLRRWTARSQFRWNGAVPEKSVAGMLAFVLARAGIVLDSSNSSNSAARCPYFTIHAGDRGDEVVEALLALVPDLFLIEGDSARLFESLADDPSVYSYGTPHALLAVEGGDAVPEVSQVTVEGYDPSASLPIIVDVVDWSTPVSGGGRVVRLADRNIGSVSEARQRGEAALRKSRMSPVRARVEVLPNWGQQVFDVVSVGDVSCGLSLARFRVRSIEVSYRPSRAVCVQKIALGAV